MKSLKKLHRMTKQGLIAFPGLGRLHDTQYKHESIWHSTGFLVIVVLVCGLMEVASFSQLFSSFLYDSPFVRNVCIIAMIIVFEVTPVVLAVNVRKWQQGYQVGAIKIVVPLSAFLIMIIVNMALRIATAELAFPDPSSAGTAIIGGGGSATAGISTRAIVYAVFFGILPVITSMASFGLACINLNPLRDELKRLDKICLEAANDRDQIDTIIKEYEVDAQFQERLMEEDLYQYGATLELIRQQRDFFMDYVRERFNEKLADPAATSYPAKYNFRKEEDM